MTQMRALCYDKTGPAQEVLSLRDLPVPELGPGDVLVRVAISGANPSDAKTRAGARAPIPFPLVIPNSDGAGRIEAVGEDIDPARIGQRVWLWNAAWQRPFGTAAEFVALPAAQAVPLPDAASYADGACLGIPAVTAHRALFADGPIEGQTVLVTGGAGSVGSYAVQMARLGGAAKVIATASPAKADHARLMGADAVVDYRAEDASLQIRAAAGGGIDRIVEVEFGQNLPITQAVLNPHGVIATYGSMADPEPRLPFYPMMFASQTLRMILAYTLPKQARAEAITDINRWLAMGALKHTVALQVPLADGWQAHAACETNTRIGTALIEVAADA
ncbi:NADPH:quinone reductase [Cereibacter sphaeroides]|nr:NADPH:quinone reductase [Cereibacter sphaeroides]